MNNIDHFLLFEKLYKHSDKPSECLSTSFLHERHDNEFGSSDLSGKWCVFSDTKSVDSLWQKIKKSVKRGDFVCAKVSTKYGIGSHANHVICVYTKSYEDIEDVKNARQKLRKIGVVEEIGYKRDIDTRNKVYGDGEWYYKE
jgi:Domain of unknown function (DUF1917)